MTVLLVAIAGAGGVLARYGISSGFHGNALPWATVAINVGGSFLLGLLVVAHWASPEARTALGVGFLGGFTTFSTFSLQAFLDADGGRPLRALVYVLASVVLGIAAAAAAKRANRVGYAYVVQAIGSTRWPKSARVWRQALPAESTREMLLSVPVPAVDWRLTRQRQRWPPQEFTSRVRRRHPASLLAGVLRYALASLAHRRDAVAALDKGALDSEDPSIADSLVLLREPPLEAVEPVMPTKQELRHVAREGWPWTALAVVAGELRAQDRLRGIELATRLLLPDPALRGATFHLACYGEILIGAKQAGFQHRSLARLGSDRDPWASSPTRSAGTSSSGTRLGHSTRPTAGRTLMARPQRR